MAARRKSARRQQLEATLLYPLDWLEERSGLVGRIRYFLFRNVPADINWMQTLGSNTNGTPRFPGPFIASILRAGSDIDPATLALFYSVHILLIPGALFGLIGLHLYLVVRLGVSSPPWSKEAAGKERVEVAPTGRAGLTAPQPRGGAGD